MVEPSCLMQLLFRKRNFLAACFMQLLVALLSRFSFITGKRYALGISDGLNCH